MSLNLLTALFLQNNEIRCFAIGPFPNGKYGGVAYFIKDKKAITPIISIKSGDYETCKDAITVLEDIVNKVRDLDLTTQEKELEELSVEEDYHV